MKKKILIVLSYVLVAVLACSGTLYATQQTIPSSKLVALENLILEKYPDEVDKTLIEDAAADAMVAAVGDRWSYYVPAESYNALMESMNNTYVGIGCVLMDMEGEERYQVRGVTSGGPADQAGMQVGDVIMEVDGTSVEGMALTDVSALIKGEAGTQVTIRVLRKGEGVSLYITRNQIETVVATGNLINDCIGYVRIENFVARSADETIAMVEELVEQGATMLLFDVRYNSGGYEDELIRVLDYLLPEGQLVRNTDKQGKDEIFSSDASCVDMPMVVLMNQDSYSAAELFAAVLKEYGAAQTVGTNTVGKGHYQSLFQLDDGSAVNLSIGKYYTSRDENLEGIGLTPDVYVELGEEEESLLYYGLLEQDQDAQLQAAVELLMQHVIIP